MRRRPVSEPSEEFAPSRAITESYKNVTPEQHAAVIRALLRRAARDIIEAGARLIHAQDTIKQKRGRGHWEKFLEAELGWDDRTALRYMTIAKAFSSETVTVTVSEGMSLDMKAMLRLSGPDVAESTREAAIEAAAGGKVITLTEAERMIAEQVEKVKTKEQRNAEDAIEALRESKDAEIKRLTAAMTNASVKEKKALKDRIKELETQIENIDLDAVIEFLKAKSKVKRLSERQLNGLALAMRGMIEVDGKKYLPQTDDEIRERDAALALTGPLSRTLEFLVGQPSPSVIVPVFPDYVRAMIREQGPKAVEWLRHLLKEVEKPRKEE